MSEKTLHLRVFCFIRNRFIYMKHGLLKYLDFQIYLTSIIGGTKITIWRRFQSIMKWRQNLCFTIFQKKSCIFLSEQSQSLIFCKHGLEHWSCVLVKTKFNNNFFYRSCVFSTLYKNHNRKWNIFWRYLGVLCSRSFCTIVIRDWDVPFFVLII